MYVINMLVILLSLDFFLFYFFMSDHWMLIQQYQVIEFSIQSILGSLCIIYIPVYCVLQ